MTCKGPAGVIVLHALKIRSRSTILVCKAERNVAGDVAIGRAAHMTLAHEFLRGREAALQLPQVACKAVAALQLLGQMQLLLEVLARCVICPAVRRATVSKFLRRTDISKALQGLPAHPGRPATMRMNPPVREHMQQRILVERRLQAGCRRQRLAHPRLCAGATVGPPNASRLATPSRVHVTSTIAAAKNGAVANSVTGAATRRFGQSWLVIKHACV